MKCAIMQPTFFPWSGYFNLISQADCFVFLDDVQFEKQSWQSRNRILVQGKPFWISAPIFHRDLNQTINQIEICDQPRWRDKLLRTLAQTYARHPHSDDMLQVANKLIETKSTNMAVVNINLILAFCDRLRLAQKFYRSSELGISGERTERLIRICEHLGCNEYLSPVGAADYLAQDGFSERSVIRLMLQQYSPLPYSQKQTADFVSHLSILDVVANLGWNETAQYVCGGARDTRS
jgi:hypothetical protein